MDGWGSGVRESGRGRAGRISEWNEGERKGSAGLMGEMGEGDRRVQGWMDGGLG